MRGAADRVLRAGGRLLGGLEGVWRGCGGLTVSSAGAVISSGVHLGGTATLILVTRGSRPDTPAFSIPLKWTRSKLRVCRTRAVSAPAYPHRYPQDVDAGQGTLATTGNVTRHPSHRVTFARRRRCEGAGTLRACVAERVDAMSQVVCPITCQLVVDVSQRYNHVRASEYSAAWFEIQQICRRIRCRFPEPVYAVGEYPC
eukprot:1195592-Prorocentrum_minimum.AAC.2